MIRSCDGRARGPRRTRSGLRHEDGPICPIDRRRTNRMARALLIAGTFLAVAMMLAHMNGVGLDERPTLLKVGGSL